MSTKQTVDAMTAPLITDRVTNNKNITSHRCNKNNDNVSVENNIKVDDKCNSFSNNDK